MANTVYDASFVAMSNGDLAGRRSGNALDRRLKTIEEFADGTRVAWYNNKLLSEYEQHVKIYRNDLVDTFFRLLADTGKKATRSTLSRTAYARLRRVRWPTHDQHLLAAATQAGESTILVTEETLGSCASAVRREFGVTVVRIV